MYSIYTKPKKWKNKTKSHKKEYSDAINNRIKYVNDRINREKEEQAKLKFF